MEACHDYRWSFYDIGGMLDFASYPKTSLRLILQRTRNVVKPSTVQCRVLIIRGAELGSP